MADYTKPNPELPQLNLDAPVEKPETDPRLLAAMDQQNKRQLYADLFRAFTQINAAGAAGTGFKADTSMADSLDKRAGQPVEQYKMQLAQEKAAKEERRAEDQHKIQMTDFQQKLQKANLDLTDMKANSDPASENSKFAQDFTINLFKQQGKPYNEQQIRSMSGANLYKMIPEMQKELTQFYQNQNAQLDREQRKSESDARLEMERQRGIREDKREERREQDQQARDEKNDRQYRQQQINTARGYMKDDPRFKKAMEQSMAFDSVNNLIAEAEKGNQQAVAALGTQLARAMGEVGMLTDTDVTRYTAGTSWGRKLKDWFQKGATGELSPETIKGIKDNLKTLKTKLNSDVQKVVDNSASRMKTAYPDLDDETIKGLLGFQSVNREPSGVKAPYGETVARNGKTYKWNAQAGKYQLAE